MRSSLFLASLFLVCVFFSLSLPAQSGNPATADGKSLVEQLDEMVSESNRYQRFRVVPIEWLNAYKANIADSLTAQMAKQAGLEGTIADQTKTIEEQATQIGMLGADIDKLNQEKDGIMLFGNLISKTVYNTILWSVIGVLLVGMLFFMARGRYAVAVTRDLQEKNTELTADLEQTRKRRLEVEQDLRRKLQDEMNKRAGL